MTGASERTPFLNPLRQKFNLNNGKLYYELRMLVEIDEGDHTPVEWKWSSILHPNGVHIEAQEQVGHDRAITAGLIDPTSGPKCLACNDRGYRLWVMDEITLQETALFFQYFDTAYDIEQCNECTLGLRPDKIYTNVGEDYCTRDELPYCHVYSKPSMDRSIARVVESWDHPFILTVGEEEQALYPERKNADGVARAKRDYWKLYPERDPRKAAKPVAKATKARITASQLDNKYMSSDELIAKWTDVKPEMSESMFEDLLAGD